MNMGFGVWYDGDDNKFVSSRRYPKVTLDPEWVETLRADEVSRCQREDRHLINDNYVNPFATTHSGKESSEPSDAEVENWGLVKKYEPEKTKPYSPPEGYEEILLNSSSWFDVQKKMGLTPTAFKRFKAWCGHKQVEKSFGPNSVNKKAEREKLKLRLQTANNLARAQDALDRYNA